MLQVPVNLTPETSMNRSPLTEAGVRATSESVALGLPSERMALLAEAFNQMVLPALQQLDAVDAGEAQPAAAFDPRWKGVRS